MADSNNDKVSFNIYSRVEQMKKNEAAIFSSIKDINSCRVYVAEKLNTMNSLKIYEEQLEKFGGSVFLEEEIEAIDKLEEIQQHYLKKKRFLLPLSIMTALGFMSFYTKNLSIKTFYENIHLVSPVFGGAYYVGNSMIDLIYRYKIRNYEKLFENTLIKARLHSKCIILTNKLKYDPDRHLE